MIQRLPLMPRLVRGLGLVLLSAGLHACGGDDVSEIEEWMKQARESAPVDQTQIPPPKAFRPFRYTGDTAVDPFDPAKVDVALARLNNTVKNGLQPDLNRRREPLEQYPIDGIRYMGRMQMGTTNVALIQVDKTLFQARVGNYIGQNFGVITRIAEGEVSVKELVQDAGGDWVERDTTLPLQETKK